MSNFEQPRIYNINDAYLGTEMSNGHQHHYEVPKSPEISYPLPPAQMARLNTRRGSTQSTRSTVDNLHPHSGFTPDQIAKLNTRRGSNQSVDNSLGTNKTGKAGVKRTMHKFTAHAGQKLSEKQKKQMTNFSSYKYQPNVTTVYKEWLLHHQPKFDFDRWTLMILSGFMIGIVAALLKQCLTALANLKWQLAKDWIDIDLHPGDPQFLLSYAWTAGISVILVTISSLCVVFVHPPAAGSGVPEILAYLNGVVVHGTMGVKYFFVKFISLVFAVSSGIPAGIQGPMIALGGAVGHGVGQFQSKTFGISPKLFSRFRNPEDRRNFTTAGVAAGVAAAFNAPIGGFMFAMEDLATFWTHSLSWQTMFCCGVSSAVANMINKALKGFVYNTDEDYKFGSFDVTVAYPINTNIAILIPAVVMGCLGGIFGALFTQTNYTILRTRKLLLKRIANVRAVKFVRVLEPIIIAIIMASLTIWYPKVILCTEYTIDGGSQQSDSCDLRTTFTSYIETNRFDCPASNGTHYYYNELGTMMMRAGSSLFAMLTERLHFRTLDWTSLLMLFPVYMFMTAWTAGSAIAGGMFMGLLVSGSLYGRAAGEGMLELYFYATGEQGSINQGPSDPYWSWVDPGFIAILGAGSLLTGVNRLTLSTTVIIVEMTRDINIFVPLLVANLCSKFMADFICKPLYKYQLDIKGLPYLDAEPLVEVHDDVPNLDLYTAGDVAASPVKSIRSVESLGALAQLLLGTEHGGFPVTKNVEGQELVYGLITRIELMQILRQDEVYEVDQIGAIINPTVDYADLAVDYISDESAAMERIRTYSKFSQFQRIFINLEAYVNMSAPKVDSRFSLERTYTMFRSMGLRHLIVTDIHNHLQGMITRNDLLPFAMGNKLAFALPFIPEENQAFSGIDTNHNGSDIPPLPDGHINYVEMQRATQF